MQQFYVLHDETGHVYHPDSRYILTLDASFDENQVDGFTVVQVIGFVRRQNMSVMEPKSSQFAVISYSCIAAATIGPFEKLQGSGVAGQL